MKTNFIYTLAVVAAISLSSCSEIENGAAINFDGWESSDKEPEKEYTLKHPCMLHTEADFTYVKGKVGASASPWKQAFAILESSPHAVASYKAAPVEYVKRLDASNWASKHPDYNNFSILAKDAAAAYQLALRWKLSGNNTYADAGKSILNDWAKQCKGIYLENGKTIDPNEFLINIQVYQLANAAEMLRDYNDWGKTDEFKAFTKWLVDGFYPVAADFLKNHNNSPDHYWLNWDLAQMTAILSIGILAENQTMINDMIQYFKSGIGAGNIQKAVVTMHNDPDGAGEKLGQCQESGRDQGHATLCVALMGYFCQMAYNIGEDLYSYDGGKAIAMAEYVAKYNLYKEGITNVTGADDQFVYTRTGFPYTSYFYCDEQMNEPSAIEIRSGSGEKGRGTKRPVWDLWYGHCKTTGLGGKYSGDFASRLRPDGGPSVYGGSGGALDQVGFSTLMHYRE